VINRGLGIYLARIQRMSLGPDHLEGEGEGEDVPARSNHPRLLGYEGVSSRVEGRDSTTTEKK